MSKNRGFTLIETLVVITIIGIISSIVFVSFRGIRAKARDAKRKSEISQIGKFMTSSCYLPNSGEGDYDLYDLATEIIGKYPQYSKFLANVPRDPKTGTETESKYIYTVIDNGQDCALYANLENKEEKITLTSIDQPTAGAGTGILSATSDGWNGTSIYFQVSNQ